MKKKSVFVFVIIIFMLLLITCSLFMMANTSDENLIYLYLFVVIYIILSMLFIIKERKNIINIKSIFIVLFTAMVGLSPVFYYLNNRTLISNTGKLITYQFPIIILGYISMLIGFNFGNYRLKKEVQLSHEKEKYKKYFSICLLVISGFFNLYYIYTNKSLFLGGNLEDGRIMALSSNGIIILLTSLYLPGIGILYDYCQKTKKSKIILYFFVILNISFYLLRGSRTSIIRMILLIILIKNSYKPIKPSNMLKLCIICIIVLAQLQVLRTSMSGGNAGLIKELYGILQVGSVNFNYIDSVFPNITPFQYGYTFLINIFMLLPGPDKDFTLWLKETLNVSFAGGGVTPTIIGEGYINFGILGVMMIMFFVGVLGNYLNGRYFKDKKNIAWISYLIIILSGIFKGGIANEEISLLTFGFLIVFYNFAYKIR